MIGRSGLFQNVDCPFFVREGGCDRPHCHFRHGHEASAKSFAKGSWLPPAASRTAPVATAAPRPKAPPPGRALPDDDIAQSLAAVNSAIAQLRHTMERHSKEGHEDSIAAANATVCAVTANVEDVLSSAGSLLAGQASSGDESGQKKNKLPYVPGLNSKPKQVTCPAPEYRPTPLAELEKLHAVSKSSQSRNSSAHPKSSSADAEARFSDGEDPIDLEPEIPHVKPKAKSTLTSRPAKPALSVVSKPAVTPAPSQPSREKCTTVENRVQPKTTNAVTPHIKDLTEPLAERSASASTSSDSPVVDAILSTDLFGEDSDQDEVVIPVVPKKLKSKKSKHSDSSKPELSKEAKSDKSKSAAKYDIFNKKKPKIDAKNGKAAVFLEMKDLPKLAPPPEKLVKQQKLSEKRKLDQTEDKSAAKKKKTATDVQDVVKKSKLTASNSHGADSDEDLPEFLDDDHSTALLPVLDSVQDVATTKKQRTAHQPGAGALGSLAAAPKPRVPSAQDQLQKRWLAMQSRKQEIMAQSSSSSSSTAEARKKEKATIAGTVDKEERRKAHVPMEAVIERPMVQPEAGGRIPVSIRQRYLNLIIDECLRFSPSVSEAYEQAVEEENDIHRRTSSKSAYLHSAVMTVKRLRDSAGLKSRMAEYEEPSPSPSTTRPTVSHEAVMMGNAASKHNFSIKKVLAASSKNRDSLAEDEIYDYMLDYVLTSEQMDEHGFPRPNPTFPEQPHFAKEDVMKCALDDSSLERVCSRCGKLFMVLVENEEGDWIPIQDECFYHWGKPWKKRIAGSLETRYNCCQSDLSVKGCCFAKTHVTDVLSQDAMHGWVATRAKQECASSPGVYAMDCEMVYTTGGCEVARVTVVDCRLKVAYDTLIKPPNLILDCNTRFSGLKLDDFETVTTTLEHVQEKLLDMLSSATILVGHSLEGDLRSLKLIHENIVDTSVVFPHRLGLPYKRGLKTLVAEYLKKIIQDAVGGHDSCEDATSCMELMLWKIKEDNRLHN